ncbi:MAG TPA: potassium channel protein [Saprospiraceae bacterium]|nr:potassium channel protein [Saprospiraceae bacterium]
MFLRLFVFLFSLPKRKDDYRHRHQRIQQTVNRLRTAILFLFLMTATGTVGYMIIEGASPFDAYYMTIITLASVGYGEVVPLSHAGRMFTSILILFNLGLFTYAISTIAHVFAEGGFTKLISEYVMLDKIQALQGHTIVCGFGRHATEVTQELAKQNIDFVVIEREPAKLQQLVEAANYLYVEGDATADQTLTEAGIERAAALVITLPDDSDNIFIVVTARQLNPRLRIICRSNQEADESKLRRAGADHVVMPERIGGFYMATLVNKPDLVEFFTLISNMGPGNVVFEELPVSSLLPKYQGRTIEESRISAECRIPVVAIRHPNGQYALNPLPNTPLQPDTHIVVFGNPQQMKKFRSLALAPASHPPHHA